IFARAEIVKARVRTVGSGRPVVAAAQTRTSELALFSGLLASDQNRTPVRADSIRPGHLCVSPGLQHLPVGATERIKEAVTIGLDERLHFATVNREIHRQ